MEIRYHHCRKICMTFITVSCNKWFDIWYGSSLVLQHRLPHSAIANQWYMLVNSRQFMLQIKHVPDAHSKALWLCWLVVSDFTSSFISSCHLKYRWQELDVDTVGETLFRSFCWIISWWRQITPPCFLEAKTASGSIFEVENCKRSMNVVRWKISIKRLQKSDVAQLAGEIKWRLLWQLASKHYCWSTFQVSKTRKTAE